MQNAHREVQPVGVLIHTAIWRKTPDEFTTSNAMRKKLKPKHQLFVDKYFELNFNQTKAAIAAGFPEAGARTQASRLLKNVDIIAEIDRRMNEHAMSANEVLFHLTAIGRGDMEDLLDVRGNPNIKVARQNRKTNLIKKLHTETIPIGDDRVKTVVTKIELYDRLKALELLAKHHDLINRVKIEDWRTQAIMDIRAGVIPFSALAEAFDVDLATELFKAAGVPVQITEGEE